VGVALEVYAFCRKQQEFFDEALRTNDFDKVYKVMLKCDSSLASLVGASQTLNMMSQNE
jgi:hypothetical protein